MREPQVLKTPALDGVELYLFRAVVPMKKLDIRLDKVTDKYGSPSIDDIEKCVGAQLEVKL